MMCTTARSPRAAARALGALTLLCLMTTLASSASATTVLRLGLDELVSQSEQIVQGKVQRAEAVVQGRRVYTIVTIQVRDQLKGAASPKREVTFTQLGGRTERLATYVPGTPTFVAGEEVIVFLERPAAHGAPLVVTGLAQGKFKVVQQGRQHFAVPIASGGLVAPIKPGMLRPVGPLQPGQTLPANANPTKNLQHAAPSPIHQQPTELEGFKRQIRETVAAQARAAQTPAPTPAALPDPTTGPTPTLQPQPTPAKTAAP